jgi:hypothetical protein
MRAEHIPSPHAPKCWICDGLKGSCGCGAAKHPELFEATRQRLVRMRELNNAAAQTAYDFTVERQRNGQLFITGKTTVDQDDNYVLAEVANYAPSIHGLTTDQLQTIMELGCLFLSNSTTIITALEEYHKRKGRQ